MPAARGWRGSRSPGMPVLAPVRAYFPRRGRRVMLGTAVMPGEPLRVTPGWRSPGPPAGAKRRPSVTWTDSASGRPERSAPQVFFDARRGIYYARPAWRGWLHLIWFGMSLAAGTVLVAGARGTERITAATIYATS